LPPAPARRRPDKVDNMTDGTARPLRIAIIGAGMAGILSAVKLLESDLDDFTIYEKGDRYGGTWRENTYPGLSCDVPSHLYSYSFAPNPEWSHRFSHGAEIQRYFEDVAHRHDLHTHTRFGEEIARCDFVGGAWHVETTSGRRDEFDIVIAATGVLHHPRYPDIAGLDTFAGAQFHSARWDHDVPIDGRRVGVVGTGSTAVQIVSAVVDRVSHVSMFQRTAQWIMPQENPPYTDEQKAGYRSDATQLVEMHAHLSEMFGMFANAVVDANSAQIKVIEEMCLANLEDNVRDPELRERLRPDYRAACKRLVVSPNFYDAIQQPNAALVTEGIERVEPQGVRTKDGVLHELDVLVLATGFHTNAFTRPMAVTGRDGRSLADEWAERPNAYLSISVPGFPNFFMINGPNGPVGNFSLIEVAELQFDYIMQLVERIATGECREISATRAAMDAFELERVEATKNTIWMTGCNSWYLDDRGIPASWPFNFDRFRKEMAAPRPDAFEMRG
jgi:cation diffusion facilitator CzcD-associated flavoprotein CzcO